MPDIRRSIMQLTEREEEIMAWAAVAFRKWWFEMSDICQRLYSGERVPFSDRRVDMFYLPFKIDVLPLYYGMRAGAAKLALGANPSLFTIVLNETGDRIVWACIENAENGVYTSYNILNDRLGRPWARKAARLLFQDKMDEAFDYLTSWVRKQPEMSHIEVGAIKVAHLSFFRVLKEAWDRSGEGKIGSFFFYALNAVKEIQENRWLRLYPDVNLSRALRIIYPYLKISSPINSVYGRLMRALPV